MCFLHRGTSKFIKCLTEKSAREGSAGGNIEANVCVPSQKLVYPFPKRLIVTSYSLSSRMHKSFMILFTGRKIYPPSENPIIRILEQHALNTSLYERK
jgi:hypothetical protein